MATAAFVLRTVQLEQTNRDKRQHNPQLVCLRCTSEALRLSTLDLYKRQDVQWNLSKSQTQSNHSLLMIKLSTQDKGAVCSVPAFSIAKL
jgi:hypothetical protein